MNEGVGRNSGSSFPAPSSSASALLSSSRSLHSHRQGGREPVLSPSGLLQHLRPRDLLLAFPLGAHLEEVLPHLYLARRPSTEQWVGSSPTAGTAQ